MYIVLPLVSILLVIIIIYYLVNKFGLKIKLNLLLICGFLGMFFGLVMPKILLPQISFTGTILLVLFLMFVLSAFLAWFFGIEEAKKGTLTEYISSNIKELSFAFNNVENDKILELTEDAMYIKNYYPEQEFYEDKAPIFADDFDIEILNNTSFEVKNYDVEQKIYFSKFNKEKVSIIDTQEFLTSNPLRTSYNSDYIEQTVVEPIKSTLFDYREKDIVRTKHIPQNIVDNIVDTCNVKQYSENEIIYIDKAPSQYCFDDSKMNFENDFNQQDEKTTKNLLLTYDEQTYTDSFSNKFITQEVKLTNNKESSNNIIDQEFVFSLKDSTINVNNDLCKTYDENMIVFNQESLDTTTIEQSIEQFLQENNPSIIDEKLSNYFTENSLVKQEFSSYFMQHCDDEDLPYKRIIVDDVDEVQVDDEIQFPRSDSIDDLLDFAFNKKEQGDYKAALSVFELAYNMYCDVSDVALLLNVEIVNAYKQLGEYDAAISYIKNAIISIDANIIKQDFEMNIAYFNIIKNVLQTNSLNFLPYSQIPVKVKEDIEKEFLQYKTKLIYNIQEGIFS